MLYSGLMIVEPTRTLSRDLGPVSAHTDLAHLLNGLVVLSVGRASSEQAAVNRALKATGAVVLVRSTAAEMAQMLRAFIPSLVVTEAAVKQHLLRLYTKLKIPEGPNRRIRLANEVIGLGLAKPELAGEQNAVRVRPEQTRSVPMPRQPAERRGATGQSGAPA